MAINAVLSLSWLKIYNLDIQISLHSFRIINFLQYLCIRFQKTSVTMWKNLAACNHTKKC